MIYFSIEQFPQIKQEVIDLLAQNEVTIGFCDENTGTRIENCDGITATEYNRTAEDIVKFFTEYINENYIIKSNE